MAKPHKRRSRIPETRALDTPDIARLFGAMPTASGAYVSPTLAENLATVTACISAIASGLASLPPLCFRATEAGREELRDHPVARLLRRPSPHLAWPDWLEMQAGSVLLHGNALAEIEFDGAGRPVALHPIPWPNVQVSVLPSGRLAYDIVQMTSAWGGTGRPRRLLEGEVWHLKDRTDDGLVGRSRISRSPEVLGSAGALQQWSSSIWANAASPSGVVEIDKPLNDGSFQKLRHNLSTRHTGAINARSVMILENGAKWKPMSVSPEDAEVLASRRFSVEELCRLYQVPPPIVQSYQFNTFTNAAQASLWFAQLTLAPWCRKIEAEFQRSVVGSGSPDVSVEIDLSGLTRGDYQTRWAANVQAVQAGILTRDEIRAQEGWGPLQEDPGVA